ncbi:hypothetical protein NEUTE1DRAFT_123573 [Neurospora tetrasperma FGSC 2508]|uniref:Uncharacterized protein n=1 Tax=Neurospora tetrasperma (strain FGSC 2508 / ATCC MYA-4615 / P0657) TaxID=510951 RepID=F8MS85_NEUT8|nr:uncharacterized protein NEUTE1DRAFT_123573 [Neurospora tetrasperma FGSC 2508]EGO55026.1 hypothetical protein NEUTE1DRAFT_123573 [Neurospora tetrasperma FGSC 2508]EGZ69769.1 ankyrin [Neurospora tetrasperma FGSC 2509]
MTITAHLYHPDFLPACRTGNLETVTRILNHETPQVSTAQLQDGLTEAVQGEHLAVADLLLSGGARVNRRTFQGAIIRGDPATFEVFINNGWDVNTTEFEEGTALRMSIKNPPLMNLLLTHGDADPNLLSIPMRGRTRRAPSALTTAIVAEGQAGADAIRTLLAHGADLEPNMLHSAIEASCRWRNVPNKDQACAERVRLLIDAAAAQKIKGGDKEKKKGGVQWYLNYLDPKKKGTPLHCAIWWRRLETVQVLVEAGADVVGSALYRGMTVIQAARRRVEMMEGQGHEEAKRIWEWLTGRRWEDCDGREEEEEEIEDVPEDVGEGKSTLMVEEDGVEVAENCACGENTSTGMGRDRPYLGFGALDIKLTLSGYDT